MACSGACIFKYPTVVNWKDIYRTIPRDLNTVRTPPILTNPVCIGDGPSVSRTRMGSQDIGIPRGSIVPHKFRNAHPLKTPIDRFSPIYGHPTPIFIKAISCKTVPNKSNSESKYVSMKKVIVHATTAKITVTKRYMHLWHACLITMSVLMEILL